MEQSNNEKNSNNNYNLLNFKINQRDKSFELKDYSTDKVYIILKDDYDKGLDYINNKDNKIRNSYRKKQEFSPSQISFYHELKDIKNENNNWIEFSIVTKEFLKQLNLDEKQYENSFVNYFEFNNVHFLLFQNNDILQIMKKENEKEEENFSDLEIIKNLILLYANNKNFFDKLKSPIKDEYDINEYYLINWDWLEEFLNLLEYEQKFKKELDNMNLNLSFKGYILKLEKIAEKLKSSKIMMNIRNLSKNKDFFNEDRFYPNNYNFKNLKEIEKIYCPSYFSLVQEILFDSLYKQIKKSNKYQKSDYSYKVLIGDNAFIIQDKNIITTYYVFFDDFEMNYLFKYIYDLTLYDEIKKYIQGKGFINYIIEKNINYKGDNIINNLKDDEDNEKIIGLYCNYKKINEKKISEVKIKKMLKENEELLNIYNEFIENINTLQTNEININYIMIYIFY